MRLISINFIFVFILITTVSVSSVSSSTEQSSIISMKLENSDLNNEDLMILESQIEITVPMTTGVIEGKNIFSYRRLNKTAGSVTDQSAVVVMAWFSRGVAQQQAHLELVVAPLMAGVVLLGCPPGRVDEK